MGIDLPEDPDSDSDETLFSCCARCINPEGCEGQGKWADAQPRLSQRMGRRSCQRAPYPSAKAHSLFRSAVPSKRMPNYLPKSGDRLVVMDERGDTPTTEELQMG